MAGLNDRETGEEAHHVTRPGLALPAGLVLGGGSGVAGVALSAIAAHSSAGPLFDTAARMFLVHAAAFVVLGAALHLQGSHLLAFSMVLLAVGLGLFCGDLLARGLSGARLFAMAAPIGGSMLMLGWAAVAAAGSVAIFRRS